MKVPEGSPNQPKYSLLKTKRNKCKRYVREKKKRLRRSNREKPRGKKNLLKYCILKTKVEKTSEKQQTESRREQRKKCYVPLKQYFYLSAE